MFELAFGRDDLPAKFAVFLRSLVDGWIIIELRLGFPQRLKSALSVCYLLAEKLLLLRQKLRVARVEFQRPVDFFQLLVKAPAFLVDVVDRAAQLGGVAIKFNCDAFYVFTNGHLLPPERIPVGLRGLPDLWFFFLFFSSALLFAVAVQVVVLVYIIYDLAQLHLRDFFYPQPSVDCGDGNNVEIDGIAFSILARRLLAFFELADESITI